MRLLIVALVAMCLVGCHTNDPQFRGDARAEDFQVTTIEKDGSRWKVWKQKRGDTWTTVAITPER